VPQCSAQLADESVYFFFSRGGDKHQSVRVMASSDSLMASLLPPQDASGGGAAAASAAPASSASRRRRRNHGELSHLQAAEGRDGRLLPRALRAQPAGLGHMTAAARRRPPRQSAVGVDRIARPRTSVIYRLLSHRSHMWYAKVFNYVLLAVILGNAVAFIIATVPTVGHETAFYTIELVTSCLFLVEYALRIVVVPEDPRNIGLSPTRARLRYVVTLRALIDAAATFPFFIELAIGYELPTLTWLRLLRCFRILKTEKATRALSSIYRVIWCVESYWCR
jgi:hypothetical protein